MQSQTPPLLIGLAAAVLLLLLIGIVPMTRRVFDRLPRLRRVAMPGGAPAGDEWIYRPRDPGETAPEPVVAAAAASDGHDAPAAAAPSPTVPAAETQVRDEPRAEPEYGRPRAHPEAEAEAALIVDDARQQARELIEQAELEAKGIVALAGQDRARRENDLVQERLALEERRLRLESLATIQEAERKAEELIAAAEARSASLVREAEVDAERRAAEIAEDARQRARERFEEAEVEAKEIVVETGKERARLLNELATERALLEETRTRLDSLTVIEEAAQKAEELLVVAEQRRDELLRESESVAERRAAEINAHARQQAQNLVDEAELEAARIIAGAGQERDRLLDEMLSQQRSVYEETRTKLSDFLSDVLEEVESMPATGDESSRSEGLDEALAARTRSADDVL